MLVETLNEPLIEPLREPAVERCVETPSEAGQRRLIAGEGRSLFLADWLRLVFIHYAVDPERLQPEVPFALDCYEGQAYVSLVAFVMHRLRFRRGGKATAWLTAPIATHPYLNVRTYVRHGGEPGIYFLAEWLPNRLSVPLGGPLFGLPYRFGRLDYGHRHEAGRVAGQVTAPGTPGALRYHAAVDRDARYSLCEEESLAAFLAERYTAFTARGSSRRLFRIWHPPWALTPLDLRLDDDTLLAAIGAWHSHARFIGAHYTPGARNVWMGRPLRAARIDP